MQAPLWMLLVWLAVSLLPALVGSQFLPDDWYATLKKPVFNPPDYIFGPVWTILYLLMGIAAWLVWKQAGWRGAPWALSLFMVQLLLNGLWTWIFFGLHQPGWALVDVLLLWELILATLILFWRQVPLAGMLLIPYLLWTAFALVLNFAVWRLNV